jgi:hypothetical protein
MGDSRSEQRWLYCMRAYRLRETGSPSLPSGMVSEMRKPTPPRLHKLSAHDIVSKPLRSQTSLICTTGIQFKGLERTETLPIKRWRARRTAGRKARVR